MHPSARGGKTGSAASLRISGVSPPRAAPADIKAEVKADNLNISVHGLRGVASLMVLFAHIFGGAAEHIYSDRPDFVAAVKPFWNFGTYGVWMFFTISGFVIMPSVLKYTPKEFTLRRFLRIYPLFLATTLLFAVLNSLTDRYPETNDFASLFFSLTFLDLFTPTVQIAPNAWSLSYEAMFYALTCMTFWVLSRYETPLKFFILLAPLAFTLAHPNTLFFLAGMAIFFAHRAHRVLKGTLSRIVETVALAGCLLFASRDHLQYYPEEFGRLLPYAVVLSTALYFYCAASARSLTATLLRNKMFLYFGTISYSLYLVHPYTYFATRHLFAHFGLFTQDISLSMAAFSLAVFVPTLIASHLAHIGLERLPYQYYFKQRIYREKP